MALAKTRVKDRPRVDDESRAELGSFLRELRHEENMGLYQSGDISRGVERVYTGVGESYNQMHRVDFYRELDSLLARKQGVIRILDVGCGLGYFLKDMLDYAESRGAGGRVEVYGINLTKDYRAYDQTDGGKLKEFKPVLGGDVIRVAHAERIPFGDGSFDMVVMTAGPYDKYGAKENVAFATHGRIRMLNELYRVTSPGGRIYVRAVCDYMGGLLDAALQFFRINHGDVVINGGSPVNPPTQIQKPG